MKGNVTCMKIVFLAVYKKIASGFKKRSFGTLPILDMGILPQF